MGVVIAPALSAVSMAHNSAHRTQRFGRKVMGLGGLRGERGQSMVEYALVLPILLLLLLGIMEFGILVFNYNTIANAAREGARYGIVHWREGLDVDGIAEAVLALTAGLDQTALSIESFIIDDGAVRVAVRVEVDYKARLVSGPIIRVFAGDDSVPLSAVATMQLE